MAWAAIAIVGYVAVQGAADVFSGFPLIGVFLLLIGPVLFGLLLAKRGREISRRPVRDVVLTATDDGLRVDAGSAQTTYDWRDLEASDHRLGILVKNSVGPIVMIPWRAFSDRRKADAFIEVIRAHASSGAASRDIAAQ